MSTIDKTYTTSYNSKVHKRIEWDKAKNEALKKERNISFEEIVNALDGGGLIKTTKHPNQTKYSNQRVYIIEISNYIYIVPHVVDNEKIFLKTIFPSRKATKKYLRKK